MEGCVRVCLLASGSKGNSIFVEAGETRLLVDAGLAASELEKRLATIGISGSDIHGILVTHEHTDHIRGAGIFARRFRIPAVVSYPTHAAAEGLFRKTEVMEFESGHSFSFRDLMIDPFPLTHDAVDPVGFRIESGDGAVGIATDLGIATRLVQEKLRGCRSLVLEFNHDEEMLLNGPYPWHLKQRIRSRHGHLSNVDSASLLDELLHESLEGLLLAHLSEVNNHPGIAERAAVDLLANRNVCRPSVAVGNQYVPTPVFAAAA
jgi:phosphoribosyl 1,2-cyclic phosphodiesterase